MQQSEASFLDIFLSQLPIFLIFLVIYYFILRPNSKKQESVKLMQEKLAKGDRSMSPCNGCSVDGSLFGKQSFDMVLEYENSNNR